VSHLSFEGQSKLDYCIECAVKHGQTAKVLMREALQRAEAQDPLSEGVKEKVIGVVEELSGAEDDTTTVKNENVTKLNTAARDLRKYIYSSKAEIGGAPVDVLREIKSKVDAFVDLAYKVREEEEICVPCVAPTICSGNEECVKVLEEASESGDKEEFSKAVEEAKKKYADGTPPPKIGTGEDVDLSEIGASVAEKRRRLIEEVTKGLEVP